MSDRIEAGLRRLFEEHRIVFWYDAAQDMRGAYEAMALDGVEKVEIANNEFELKYRILRQQRKQKFSTREYTRCSICGRPHSVLKKYGICRICFRELAYKGQIPGVKKSSW